MKIIIAGAGAVGTHLAKLLSDEKQDIILMDENEEKLSKLDSNFDLMTVNASPTSIDCRARRTASKMQEWQAQIYLSGSCRKKAAI